MATFTKNILSGSADGRSIKVVATTSPGTLIHTGSSVATTLDEVWLYAMNSDTTSRVLTIQWGNTTSPDDSITINLNPSDSGLTVIVPGLLIKGNSSSALVVRAFAETANKIMIHGYVHRIEV